jgi:hypothetical protein
MDFYRPAGSTEPFIGAINFCYGQATDLNCPTINAKTIPPQGGTVSTSIFVPSNDTRFLGKPIIVMLNFGIVSAPAATIYFDNARLEATPLVAHSSGFVGMFAHRPGVTAQLNALCQNSTGLPCDLALEFHDIHGVLVSQRKGVLRPGETASLDQPVSRDFMPDGGELIPRWFLKSGAADVSFEMIDSSTMRTDLFVNWGDGSAPQVGNLDSGPVAITPLDALRVKVYCDGTVRNSESRNSIPCSATLGFADPSGRMLKLSRMVLEPGTGGYLDLHYEDTPQTMPRQTVIPQLTVTGGNAVGGFAVLDRATGGTVTQSFPGTAATVR